MAKKVVQNTNLSCVVSKWSTHEQGYVIDPFIKYVTDKMQRRSPLINRGYYIRAQAFRQTLRQALLSLSTKDCLSYQVISLGAGFDTTYFRLKSERLLSTACRYYEIDFRSVLEQKLLYIKQNAELRNLIGDFKCYKNADTVLLSDNFVMVGGDLYNLQELEQRLLHCGMNLALPTIILSECVLNYMEAVKADAILKWAAEKFPSSVFIMYEQICPEDGFGNVMKDHFLKIGSPLLSIDSYPDVAAQRKRFLHLGWPDVEVKDLNMIHGQLEATEISRVSNLEPFDEFEEFHLKCSHYILVMAEKGWQIKSTEVIPCKSEFLYHPAEYQDVQVDWETVDCPTLSRFGHAAVKINRYQVLVSGGFGHHDKGHKRLPGLQLFHLFSGIEEQVALEDPENFLGERLFHQLVLLSCQRCLILLGGRSSPGKVLNHPTFLVLSQQDLTHQQNNFFCDRHSRLQSGNQFVDCSETEKHVETKSQSTHCDEIRSEVTEHTAKVTHSLLNTNQLTSYKVTKLNSNGELPEPRWRHSATSFVNKNGQEKILLFGGYNHKKETLGDCYIFNVLTSLWTKVEISESGPSPRHSHSCVLWNGVVWLSGGMTERMEALGDIFTFDTETETWSEFRLLHPVIPRYSHTSSILNNRLFLVGGVTSACTPMGTPGIAQVCLQTGESFEIKLQPPKEMQPVLLFKHSSYQDQEDGSIWIIGGGGNCFSFGTAFNKNLIKLKIN